MGTNRRYADAIDRRIEQQVKDMSARPAMPHPVVRDWRPPWPPVLFSEDEWFLMRDSNRQPAAVIRKLRMGPRNETFYRVVTWAAKSADRTLIGHFPTLEEVDRSVLFRPDNPQVPTPAAPSRSANPRPRPFSPRPFTTGR
jgi:hypothetical protein